MPYREVVEQDELNRMIAERKAQQQAKLNPESVYSNNANSGKSAIVDEIAQMAAERKNTKTPSYASTPTVTANPYAAQQNALAQQQAALAKQQASLDNVYARYSAMMQEQEAAAKAQKEAEQAARREQYALSRDNVNAAADDALRQAYILRRKQLAQMPQQNALMGNGGLSETAMLQMEANYGNNRSALETERLAQLANLETQLNEGLAIDEGNYYQRLQQIQQQRAEQENAREIALANAAAEAAQGAVSGAANSITYNDYANAMKVLEKFPTSVPALETVQTYTGVPYEQSVEQQPLPAAVVARLEEAARRFPIGSREWNDYIEALTKRGELNNNYLDSYNSWLSGR